MRQPVAAVLLVPQLFQQEICAHGRSRLSGLTLSSHGWTMHRRLCTRSACRMFSTSNATDLPALWHVLANMPHMRAHTYSTVPLRVPQVRWYLNSTAHVRAGTHHGDWTHHPLFPESPRKHTIYSGTTLVISQLPTPGQLLFAPAGGLSSVVGRDLHCIFTVGALSTVVLCMSLFMALRALFGRASHHVSGNGLCERCTSSRARRRCFRCSPSTNMIFTTAWRAVCIEPLEGVSLALTHVAVLQSS